MLSSTEEDSNSDAGSSMYDSSEPDFATVLSQLMRSGRAHILSERNFSLDRQSHSYNEYGARDNPPSPDAKPDLSILKETDIYLSTSMSAGLHKRCITKMPQLLWQRQIGSTTGNRFSQGDRSFISHTYLPNEFIQVANYSHKMFCGTFSRDGNVFLSASQDRVIRVFDTSRGGFEKPISIQAQDVGWAILDTAFSPSGQEIIYSSWSEAIHLCDLRGSTGRHEVLSLDPEARRFCIFSLMFSHDGDEVLGGANDGCLYVYDCITKKRTLRIKAHEDDVNAVTFADETSQILFSGADDGLCKVWDRRTLVESSARPVGIFAGHVDGLTYVDSRGDGRHLITNSKDQSIKLWDMRHFSSSNTQDQTKQVVRTQNWDYRWQSVPWRLACSNSKIEGDTSLMTYRGHSVLQTLIRCHFSPMFNTGQRYIYTGCASGQVVIYDVLTGKKVAKLLGHTACVRDVSWHPYKNEIIDSAWDGRHYKWFYVAPDSNEMHLDFSECDTDSDNDSTEESEDWVARQRREHGDGVEGTGRVRRSPRIAAQRQHRPTSETRPVRTSMRRTRPSQ